MPRPAAISRDQIRTTVLAMLAEAGMDAGRLPPSGARFRQVVSVRKLRARLGAGDPTTLSRALNDIEADVVRAGLADIAIPDLPDAIAEQMRALWQSAVTVQLDDVVRLKADTTQRAEAADAARHDADLRVELLRVELAALREHLAARDTDLATARAEFRTASARTAELDAATSDLQAQLAKATAGVAHANDAHAAALATVHARYEGLSRQLLQETAHQRHTFQVERERLTGQIAEVSERVAAFEGLRERLLAELASERNAHRDVAAEVAALKTIVSEQRIALRATRRAGSRTPRASAANGSGRAPRPAAAKPADATRRRSR